MRVDVGEERKGTGSFTITGFTNWKKRERLGSHTGYNEHRLAWTKCQNLMNQKKHIEVPYLKESSQSRKDYRIQLPASVECVRHLLWQGSTFRGHEKSDNSSNRRNFIELLKYLANHNEVIHGVVLKNAPKNLIVTSHEIQKDIVNAAACETTKVLVDESRDTSHKEQMVVLIRHVNKMGCVIECFLGSIHVADTTSLCIKSEIESLFSKYGLSLSKLRGKVYDGASNMREKFNSLKSLILKENEYAFYTHCFAHQLQLTLVAVAKNHNQIALFFNIIGNLVNVVLSVEIFKGQTS